MFLCSLCSRRKQETGGRCCRPCMHDCRRWSQPFTLRKPSAFTTYSVWWETSLIVVGWVHRLFFGLTRHPLCHQPVPPLSLTHSILKFDFGNDSRSSNDVEDGSRRDDLQTSAVQRIHRRSIQNFPRSPARPSLHTFSFLFTSKKGEDCTTVKRRNEFTL